MEAAAGRGNAVNDGGASLGDAVGVGTAALPGHFCPQCGQLTGVSAQSVVAPIRKIFCTIGV